MVKYILDMLHCFRAKPLLFFLFVLLAYTLNAQILLDTPALSNEEIIVSDSLPESSIPWGFENTSAIKTNRIASFIQHNGPGASYFLGLLLISIVLTTLVSVASDFVTTGVRSFFNLNYGMQFVRHRENRNALSYYMFLSCFMFLLAELILVGLEKFYNIHLSYWYILSFIVLYFLFDFVASYIYLLFLSNNRVLDWVRAGSYYSAVFLLLIVWPGLTLVVYTSPLIGFYVFWLCLILVVVFLLSKEVRSIQILSSERVNVFSFQFFTYFCTFKILPMVVFIMALVR